LTTGSLLIERDGLVGLGSSLRKRLVAGKYTQIVGSLLASIVSFVRLFGVVSESVYQCAKVLTMGKSFEMLGTPWAVVTQ
jgi:hypothetical protein